MFDWMEVYALDPPDGAPYTLRTSMSWCRLPLGSAFTNVTSRTTNIRWSRGWKTARTRPARPHPKAMPVYCSPHAFAAIPSNVDRLGWIHWLCDVPAVASVHVAVLDEFYRVLDGSRCPPPTASRRWHRRVARRRRCRAHDVVSSEVRRHRGRELEQRIREEQSKKAKIAAEDLARLQRDMASDDSVSPASHPKPRRRGQIAVRLLFPTRRRARNSNSMARGLTKLTSRHSATRAAAAT